MEKESVFQEKAPYKGNMRLCLHVGPGLSRFTGQVGSAEVTQVLAKVESVVRNATRSLPSGAALDHKESVLLVAPELLRDEAATALDVMRKFRKVRATPGTLLTVATFSQNVASAIIDAMCGIGYPDELIVCYHQDTNKGLPSVHWLDDEGRLTNWRFGVLYAHLEEDDLRELDFASLKAQ